MADFETDFATYGFRAKAFDDLIVHIRLANSSWFELADAASKAVQVSAARAVDGVRGSSLDPRVLATLIATRASGNFQGALILLERGMVVEGRTLIRSSIEASLCLAALHDNPTAFIEMFKADDAASRKAQARFMLNQNLVEGGDPTVAERLKNIVDDCAGTRNLPLLDLAALGAYNSKYLYYRLLSHDAGHVSARSLHRHMQFCDGGWTDYQWGPDDASSVAETLSLGILIALGLGVAFTQIVGDAEGNKEFADLSEKHRLLCQVHLVPPLRREPG